MKSMNSNLLFSSVLLILVWSGSLLWAGQPKINITLQIKEINGQFYDDLPFYYDNDPIIAKLAASNDSNEKILINRDFSSQMLLNKMRLIDPSGRMLRPRKLKKRNISHNQSDYMPPLPFGIYDDPNDGKPGAPIRFAPCKILPVGDIFPKDQIINLRDYYDFELPGYYSAQIEVSAMTFNGGTCNADAPQWVGLLKSGIHSFYVVNKKNEVKIEPHIWNLSKPSGEIRFLIRYMDKMISADAKGIHVYLNYNQKLTDIKRNGDWLVAKGGEKKCVQSLGVVNNGGNWITVTVRLKNGKLFGGSKKGKIYFSNGEKKLIF